MNAERVSGYYWVRIYGEKWDCAEWDQQNQHWSLTGIDTYYSDSELIEIKERRILSPDDMEQLVNDMFEKWNMKINRDLGTIILKNGQE